MRGYYSVQPRFRSGPRLSFGGGHYPDPYGPTSPDYGKRTRETATQIAPGMTIINIGEPIKAVAGSPQPVPIGPPPAPVAPPPEPVTPPPAPAPSRKAWREPDWRALSRGT